MLVHNTADVKATGVLVARACMGKDGLRVVKQVSHQLFWMTFIYTMADILQKKTSTYGWLDV